MVISSKTGMKNKMARGISFKLSFSKKHVQIVQKRYENLRNEIPKVARSRIRDFLKTVKDIMKTPGKPVKYPIKWASIKQRMAYFATDAFTIKGKRPKGYKNTHIPWVRKRTLENGWKIEKLADNKYSLENRNKASIFVYGGIHGEPQAKMFEGRWKNFRDTFDRLLKKMPKAIKDSIKSPNRSVP